VIVDNKGKALAHPNAAWVSQMQNLSQDEIVKSIQTGNGAPGALEYYSSTNKEDMIGGYSGVGKLGWGVMVMQPAAEIYLPFENIKTAIISWVAIGLLIALFFAFLVTRKITSPLSKLVNKAKQLDVRSESFRLGEVPERSPIEIRVLWNTISKLIVSFQEANAEVNSLSGSMSKDLRSVVAELRANNLSKESNQDPLTGITSRDCFKTELNKALTIHKGEEIGVILIDVHNYGSLVAQKGDDLGEEVIKHVAKILTDNIRDADMAARYDDENKFVVYINSSNPKSLQGTAEKLRALVEMNPVIWKQQTHYISLSIGIVCQKIENNLSYEALMANAEKTLEKSKSIGNNHISSHHLKHESAYSNAPSAA
jgi:diguanylate cyclase